MDVVLDVLFYHDTVWLGVDREKMNRAVFAALKPGGVYGIVDHSGLPGSGLSGVQDACIASRRRRCATRSSTPAFGWSRKRHS